MEQVEIPTYFLCPISLQIMKDPVTLSTGITYDRESIEQWLFAGKHGTCPVTRQPLPDDAELTPNHTLRRLIQAWCTVNASDGIERFPTPKPPVNKTQIALLLDEAKKPLTQMSSLRKLRVIISESERNKRCVESTSGLVDFLASIVVKSSSSRGDEIDGESTAACDEALNLLHTLQISEQGLLNLISKHGNFIESLTTILQQSSYQSRAYAISLLKSLTGVVEASKLSSLEQELFDEVVQVVRDQNSCHATKAALHVLAVVCPLGRNRIKAVGAGAVPVLVEMLLEESERRVCELALVVLDRLCGCAEGRAELVRHPAGIAVVSKKIFRVSEAASERAVRVLASVSRYAATAGVLQEMVQVRAVCKLCLVVRGECGEKTKEKAREILRLHSSVWRSSPCLSPQFLALYPSN
ncbi:E3 ubiquitin-protein ligase PUB23-like [Typha latifolia]|uniref:E3 ubiquitin-protein ligase PUB23-like n=1 Tax=Typha latifolia TaxID=4733 RepID=UPI003C2CF885